MSDERSWTEKLRASTESEVRPVPPGRKSAGPGRTMLFPSAQLLNDTIRAIPEGQSMTPRELRSELARRHAASLTCPVTTARMLRLVAEAANEVHRNGLPLAEVTPVWRVLDSRASALRKLTFDPAYILDQRAEEGLPS